jgi:DNA-directed RNA polymerase alpha subunit
MINLARVENAVLHHILGIGTKPRKMSQQEVYQKYLELSTQCQGVEGSSNIERELVLDILWDWMDGRIKRHLPG